MLDCLENIVGLSHIDCPCIEQDRPSDWDESTSGYYLTDLEHGVNLQAAVFAQSECFGGQNIWQLLQEAVRTATLTFQTDLLSAIFNRKDSQFTAFSGNIGKSEATTTIYSGKRYNVIRIEPLGIKGGLLTINSVSVGLNCDADLTLYISNNSGEILATESVTTQAGQFTEVRLSSPLSIPLYDNSCDRWYYVYYEVPDGCDALQNKFQCCGNVPHWKKYLKAGGSNVDVLENASCTSNIAFGLSINGTLNCEGLDWICELQGNNWSHNFKNVIGKAILLKAAATVNSMIVKSNNINFFTLSSKETLFGCIRSNNKKYYERIEWLADNIPMNLTDCFTCKQSNQRMRVASIY